MANQKGIGVKHLTLELFTAVCLLLLGVICQVFPVLAVSEPAGFAQRIMMLAGVVTIPCYLAVGALIYDYLLGGYVAKAIRRAAKEKVAKSDLLKKIIFDDMEDKIEL